MYTRAVRIGVRIADAIRQEIALRLEDLRMGVPRDHFDRVSYYGVLRNALPLSHLSWLEVWCVTVEGRMIGIRDELECEPGPERPGEDGGDRRHL